MYKKISIILPVYNEASNINLVYEQVQQVVQNMACYAYEIIFVDDGSTDDSWYLLTHLAQCDNRVKAIRLSRNFGHQYALTAGYDHATGDAIITMDADLQDPPLLIALLLAEWEKGFHIVYARRINRKDPLLKRIMAYWFYIIFERVANIRIARNVGDFRLIDKKVLAVLQQCKERHRYLRGMVAWTGFSHAFVDFNRAGRHRGTSGYTWKKMISLACDGVMGFSLLPLRIMFGVAFIACMMSCLCIWYHTTSLAITMLSLIISMQCGVLWILGVYIGRIYEQQQARPLYVIDQAINLHEVYVHPLHIASHMKEKQGQ